MNDEKLNLHPFAGANESLKCVAAIRQCMDANFHRLIVEAMPKGARTRPFEPDQMPDGYRSVFKEVIDDPHVWCAHNDDISVDVERLQELVIGISPEPILVMPQTEQVTFGLITRDDDGRVLYIEAAPYYRTPFWYPPDLASSTAH